MILDGSASSDPDGMVVAWDWDLDNDGTYEASGATVQFNAASFGTCTVGLRVTDDSGGTDADTATVTAANLAPTASAGGSYSGNEGTAVQLDGTSLGPILAAILSPTHGISTTTEPSKPWEPRPSSPRWTKEATRLAC